MRKINIDFLLKSMNISFENNEGLDVDTFDVNTGIFEVLKASDAWKHYNFKKGIKKNYNYNTDYFVESKELINVYIKFQPARKERKEKDKNWVHFRMIEKNGKLTFEEYKPLLFSGDWKIR